MTDSAGPGGRWADYDKGTREQLASAAAGAPGTPQGAPQSTEQPQQLRGRLAPRTEIPPKDPFAGWSLFGLALFIVGVIAAIVCFANSGGTETSGSGWSSVTVDVVYMDVLAGAICCSLFAAAGLVVAVVAKVGSHVTQGARRGDGPAPV